MCGWIVFGFLVGLIARALMPGTQKMGFIATTLLGVAGSFVGGFIANLVWGGPLFSLRPTESWVGSIIGAIVLMAIVGAVNKNRRLPR
jgi:uncharacterized membrane protein YeaQ/YmgE (transglycosylase-associated protein family)